MNQANHSQADWLNTVAHDLKTPINFVRGCIELMQQLGPLNDRQQQFAEKAINGLVRMEHLVARLLDISWIDAGMALDLQECDLAAIIHEAVDMLRDAAESRGISLHVELDEPLQPIMGDAQWLAQVMDNLVSNAVKYNRDGGQVWVRATQDVDRIIVSVRDTGMGITAEDQPRVFERFFRAREGVARRIEGSGLGLAITRAIVQKHGGRIWFESQPGEGTTFFVSLPLEISEGGDRVVETQQTPGEGEDNGDAYLTDAAMEERDSVNDAFQEQRERPRVDPSGSDET
ncbi:MAG: HAMP domain-containing histidine kinase [Chloroflexi bacterium]|nr:HAMP domain-containing histidine kinase [Chloroflexota bacterium]